MADDHVTDGVVRFDDFVHRCPAVVPGIIARVAACAVIKRRDILHSKRMQVGNIRAGRRINRPAFGANQLYKALRHHAHDGRSHDVWLEAHIHKTHKGGSGVVGVQARQYKMPGDGGARSDIRGLRIADFPDHNNIRILPQEGAQAGGKGKPGLGVHLRLADAGNHLFHRVFHRNDVHKRRRDLCENRIQRGGFSAPGRSGHQHDAVWGADQPVKKLDIFRRHTQLLDFINARLAVC